MSPTAEAGLLDGLRRGDTAAAERVVSSYGARAYRLAVGITQNAEDAEEIVQDAFWGAMDSIDTFGGEAALGSWLYRVVATAALRKARRTRERGALDDERPENLVRRSRLSLAESHDWSGRLDDPALAGSLRAALSAAMDDLPPEYRAVVLLRDGDGLAMADVARVLHMPLADAKTMLHRARLVLRGRLAAFMATAVTP
jgi:RNA polymerase sigma-70 factor, ECF subfamily